MNTATGEFKQIGKSCLKDYCGLDVELVALFESFEKEANEHQEYEFISGGYKRYFKTFDYLKFVAETTTKFGYSKTENRENSTRERSFGYYSISEGSTCYFSSKELEVRISEMKKVNFNADLEENIALVNSAIEWILQQEETSEYIHNLKVLCSLEYVTYRELGILSSLIHTYNKAIEKAKQLETKSEEAKISNYIGTVGEKINVAVNKFECVTSFDTQWGTTYIYKFVNENGNVIIWKTSKWIDTDKVINSISGTIKSHNEYNGCKQTEITRCKVA